MAKLVAILATTHHPFYLQDQPAAAGRGAAVRRRVGAQGRGLPGDADPGPAGRAGHGRLRPLPPAVAGQHAAVPGRQGAVLRRELLQRGARVRAAAAAAARATRNCRRTSCARASTAGSTWRSPTSCGSTTRSPARSSPCGRRTTCRSCRSTPTSSRRRCRGPSGSCKLGRTIRELIDAWPSRPAGRGDRHRPPVPGARRPAPVRPARSGSGVRRPGGASGSPTATSTRCLANVTLDSLHAPGNATHGFMDFMLMMGIAGYHKADYADNLDLFHTMEAYFTWYPNGGRRSEQIPARQVPVHRRPRPRTGRALPGRPGRDGGLVGGGASQPDPELPLGRGVHLARLHRGRAGGAAYA